MMAQLTQPQGGPAITRIPIKRSKPDLSITPTAEAKNELAKELEANAGPVVLQEERPGDIRSALWVHFPLTRKLLLVRPAGTVEDHS